MRSSNEPHVCLAPAACSSTNRVASYNFTVRKGVRTAWVFRELHLTGRHDGRHAVLRQPLAEHIDGLQRCARIAIRFGAGFIKGRQSAAGVLSSAACPEFRDPRTLASAHAGAQAATGAGHSAHRCERSTEPTEVL